MWQPKDTAPFAFIPRYGIGGGIDIARKDTSPQRGGTWEYDNTKYQPPLYHNAAPNLFDENVTHAKDYQPYINGGGGRLEKPNYKGKTFANGSKKRSKFFQGVADAMAEQWAAYACR